MKLSEAVAAIEELIDQFQLSDQVWVDYTGVYDSKSVSGAVSISPSPDGGCQIGEIDISFSQDEFITLEWTGKEFIKVNRSEED